MKKFIVTILLVYVVCLAALLALFLFWPSAAPDALAINDLVKTSEAQSWDASKLAQEIGALHSDMNASRQARDTGILIALGILFTVFVAGTIAVIVLIDRRFLKPFRAMEDFAQQIASGNLDAPLLANKEESFGAFTESFDLMRTELARAQEAERAANQGKKELIASLSHDIKTPLASIKASSELLAVTSTDNKQRESAATIISKVDQVTNLVNKLFDTTMQELHELEIKIDEVSSKTIEEMIARSDYRKLASIEPLPECLVYADEDRLAQVFDNIISNSYKYASTPLEIKAHLDNKALVIDVSDFGNGVAEEELVLLTQKFYRGANAGDLPGVGLGLYNAALFAEGMSGGLMCFNEDSRFVVRVVLKLA